MNFQDTINKFLNTKKNDSLLMESSLNVYEVRLKMFSYYVCNNLDVTNENYRTIFTGFSEEEFVKVIDSYIVQRRLNAVSPANLYFTVIREYFTYLISINIKNVVFEHTERIQDLENRIKELYDKRKLSQTEEKGVLSEDGFIKLNSSCNSIIKNSSLENIMNFKGVKKDPYDLLVSAICIKLTLLLGVKPNELLKIKREDFNLNNSTLTLNEFVIKLPDNLSKSLTKYIGIVDEKFKDLTTDYLLLNRDGERFTSNDYGYMFKVEKTIIETASAEYIAKHSIIQMIKSGIDVGVVLKLTGFSNNTYEYCQELNSICISDDYLNSKFEKSDYFSTI